MDLETERYLIASRSALPYAVGARLRSQVEQSKILMPTTPNWRSWWKSFRDPQKGVFQPPMLIITIESYAFQEHQNVGTMARSGVIIKRDTSVGTDMAMYELKAVGNMVVIERDAVKQIHLGTTILHYLQSEAFSYKVRLDDFPQQLPCRVHTENKNLDINGGFVLEEGSESGDVSSLTIPFYVNLWTVIKKPIKLVQSFHVKMLGETVIIPEAT